MSDTTVKQPPTKEEMLSLLYPKEAICPVCEKMYIDQVVRTSKLRVESTDGDLRHRYQTLDPVMYEAQLCYQCGYAALRPYFEKIDERQKDIIRKKITPEYKTIEYPAPYTAELALTRYDQALLCCEALEVKYSRHAITYLKKGWVLRDMIGRKADEMEAIRLAYENLQNAFTTENFPLGNLDEITSKYMISELARRLGNFKEALRWIGDVIISRDALPAIKKRAELVKEQARAGISD